MSQANPHVPCRGPRARALFLSAALGLAVSGFPAGAGAEEAPTGSQVRAAILRAVDSLKQRQEPGGGWADYSLEGGVTALVAWSLLEAGVAPDAPPLPAALERVRRTAHRDTYVVALKALALASADPKRHKADLQSAADWLVEAQHPTGAWGYGKPPGPAVPSARSGGIEAARAEAQRSRVYGRPDASNSQFAVLALAEAERAGATVPLETWRRADRYFRVTQLPGGGWGYVYHDPDPEEAYGSMTAAAVASLCLAGDRLARHEPADATADRLAAVERGLDWMAQHFSLLHNPNRDLAWYYFWLYGVERVGVISGRRTFAGHDWFREGTAILVAGQRADGSWTDRLYHDALCLLFLAKGYKPLLVQRLQWEGQWRRDPRDLDHLVRFLGTRVGGQAVAWQTLASTADLAEYLAAPILHVTGRGPVRMLTASLPRLRHYVEQGGLLLFDPEDGDEALVESVRGLVRTLFPESEFQALAADHPLYRAVHRLAPAGLEGANFGCRTAVLLAPRGLATAWAAADPQKPDDSLRLGENLAAYATGQTALPDRLATATVLQMPTDLPPPRGAYRLGQVQHDGDWNPRPYALPGLLKDLASRFGVAVHSRPMPVRLTDPTLGQFPVLYLTGHYAFHLTDAEREALRAYLDRGGVLWAEACCGRPAFDKALRDLVAAVFPDAALTELPADHPIYKSRLGASLAAVAYTPAVRAESPGLARPVLYGLERGGHLVLVYSPYGLACGLDGLTTHGARALVPDDARRLAINILLHVFTK